MILIDDTCVSDDIADHFFVCHIEKCKGACCVEGDSGAPLEESELQILEKIYDRIEPYLTESGKKAIAEQGLFTTDRDGDYVTPVIGNRECAYAVYDENRVLKCAFELAYQDGKTDFKKPISCHLYPIRVTKYDQYHALNYDRWSICQDACTLGEKLGVPLFRFLKEPLIRAYGKEWYDQLTVEAEAVLARNARK